MIRLITGGLRSELDENDVLFVEGTNNKLLICNGDLFCNRSSNSDIYTLVNLNHNKNSISSYYRVGIDGHVFTIRRKAVVDLWAEFCNNKANDITIVVNGAQVGSISSQRIAESLGVSREEALNIIREQYSDTLVTN